VAEVLLGGDTPTDVVIPIEASVSPDDVLIEPGKKELLASLRPKTLKLKLYAALLDSVAAEHAARTVAMQTATDNAENLLSELTLQYNKGRQQKITSEILDLAGGQTE
jgi:F-type H+-transporting ATPase subunit gamma